MERPLPPLPGDVHEITSLLSAFDSTSSRPLTTTIEEIAAASEANGCNVALLLLTRMDAESLQDSVQMTMAREAPGYSPVTDETLVYLSSGAHEFFELRDKAHAQRAFGAYLRGEGHLMQGTEKVHAVRTPSWNGKGIWELFLRNCLLGIYRPSYTRLVTISVSSERPSKACYMLHLPVVLTAALSDGGTSHRHPQRQQQRLGHADAGSGVRRTCAAISAADLHAAGGAEPAASDHGQPLGPHPEPEQGREGAARMSHVSATGLRPGAERRPG